ncbi:hypothetical protein [Paraburkholderia graminis]|uniref:hypothetical protein n=1 Tax=Paraburkholderia graminis TaxID=60548 RepID=UPI0038B6C783
MDLQRANLALALQLMGFGLEARQGACEFEMQRIQRDVAAAHAIRNAATSFHDCTHLAGAYKATARDYLATTTNLWQQGWGSAVRLQGSFSERLHEALATWQSTWGPQWPAHVPMNPGHEWLQRVQSATGSVLAVRASRGDGATQASRPTADHETRGEPHVG